MRIGIYGGSFDPIHIGHLLLADSALNQMRLDRVDFVPRSDSWQPKHHFKVSGEDRYQMTLLATASCPEFAVNDYEIVTKNALYTVDTLSCYRNAYPNDDIFLIVSSETFNQLPSWHNPEMVCQLASMIIARRGGYSEPDFEALRTVVNSDRIEEFRRQVVEMPSIELSSTYLRHRISTGQSVRFMIPDDVIDYIQENEIYTMR